ncbi:hypothetical protein PoB_003845800 [Plakobranchus ocellatus]|uniref:Uncharacterized protein n=1 Tax=Plakobranchus ocellatus TaxID=259542 RepID=A0AAV4AZN6_9GAST|nr:hypothetical protein PoB_003845800 [Plakobranchus ocellatus]
MSLELAELVSVTNNAVRSLENPQLSLSSGGSRSISGTKPGNFDSPFESPKSLSSACGINGIESQGIDSGIGKSSATALPAKVEKRNVTKSNIISGSIKPNSSKDKEQPTLSDLAHDLNNSSKTCSLEQDASLLDTSKSKDLSLINRQETTTSDNNLASSQGSKASEKILESNVSYDLNRHHKNIHVNVSRNRPWRNQKERETRENNTDQSDHCSEDLEIIDVPECIIAVKSGVSSGSEDDSTFNEIDTVVEANRPQNKNDRFFGLKSFGKSVNTDGGALKQGALSKGILDPLETAQHGDVYISQFGLTERQRGLKEALARRAENSHPKKKVVQPRLIPKQRQSDVDSDLDSARLRPGQPASTDHAVTAAVAASAAVAATQPFLKVAELNERRLEHLESLQQQQMQMQAQLLFMSRSRNPQHKPVTRIPQAVGTNFSVKNIPDYHSSQQFQPALSAGIKSNSSRPNTSPSRSNVHPTTSAYFNTNSSAGGSLGKRSGQGGQPLFNPEMLSSHFNYLNEVRELQGSHLDTPAPREKVPKPTPYSLPQPHSQKSLGFLEELLAQREDLDKDTTFNVKADYSPPTKLQQDSANRLEALQITFYWAFPREAAILVSRQPLRSPPKRAGDVPWHKWTLLLLADAWNARARMLLSPHLSKF